MYNILTYKTIVLQFFMSFLCLNSFGNEKIKVLLLSGANNHKWEETTPALEKILESSGLFDVEITEEPEKMSAEMLRDFQLVLSNWNLYPEKKSNWSEKTKQAVIDFVKGGGGFLFIHAASSANYDWKAYQDLSGATWGDNTRHGNIAPFEVVINNTKHPVTKGMSNFWINGELWVNMKNYQTANVLASAFAPIENNGSDAMEPVIFEQKYGKGRTFYLVPGHDKQVMKNLGFQTLLLRGAEWAASGKVKQKIPKELSLKTLNKGAKYNWEENDNAVSLKNNNSIVWTYNFNKTEGKPYFHPLNTTTGTEITWFRPEDHPWHRAIWFSWKFINGVNYWEEDRETRESEGLTIIKNVDYSVDRNKGASFELNLSYRPSEGSEVLTEQRVVKVSLPDENGNYFIDWESTFSALTDKVILDRTPLPNEPKGKRWGGYAGFSARLNQHLWDVKVTNTAGEHKNLHGTSSQYLTYEAKNIQGNDLSMTIFDHPDNTRHPNKWYVETGTHHPFYFFSPCPLFDAKLTLSKGEVLHLKYRLLISSDKSNLDLIQANWKNFKSQ